jgi:hypothetical protein
MPGPVCVGEERRSNSYCSEPDEEGDGEEGARRPATSARTFTSPVRCRPASNRDDTYEWTAPNANVAASVTHGFARTEPFERRA